MPTGLGAGIDKTEKAIDNGLSRKEPHLGGTGKAADFKQTGFLLTRRARDTARNFFVHSGRAFQDRKLAPRAQQGALCRPRNARLMRDRT